MRQIHHWAALFFVAAIVGAPAARVLHRCVPQAARDQLDHRRRAAYPRLLEGFAGYSLPDDLLSGTGLRIAQGIMLSIPVGRHLFSFFVFGGEFPGTAFMPRLYTVHILLVPGIILALITVHLMLIWYQKHTQFPGPGRTERTSWATRFLPIYMAKAGGFFFVVFGIDRR